MWICSTVTDLTKPHPLKKPFGQCTISSNGEKRSIGAHLNGQGQRLCPRLRSRNATICISPSQNSLSIIYSNANAFQENMSVSIKIMVMARLHSVHSPRVCSAENIVKAFLITAVLASKAMTGCTMMSRTKKNLRESRHSNRLQKSWVAHFHSLHWRG